MAEARFAALYTCRVEGEPLSVGGQLGSYLLESVVGRGGMSVVYRARHTRLGMQVAVKVLAPELGADDRFRERFLREAQAAASIDHPNVIPVHDMGMHAGCLYIVMRFVPGGDLRRLLDAEGPQDGRRACELLAPVASALDAAHAHGLIHRDVKPGNILLQRGEDGEVEHVYLTDFGIAKSHVPQSDLTSPGAAVGTLGYMAPEQLAGGEVLAQTDVYALAATLYECVTGEVPHQAELGRGLVLPEGPPTPASRLRAGLPGGCDAVLARGLEREPGRRFATCRELVASFGEAAAGPSAAAVGAFAPTALSDEQVGGGDSGGQGPERGEEAAGTAPRRRRGRAALYALAAVLLIAAGAGVALLLSSSKGTSAQAAGSPLRPVPTNHVTGSGSASVSLSGDNATVTVTVAGLDGNAPLAHLMHIHANGRGICPPASAARLHNGHLAISTTDGINYYGPPVQALTSSGDTSVSSILVFPRYVSGGTFHYQRTIALPADVARAIRSGNAVVVVHGIDYDGTGIYSGVLERSEIDHQVPATATAPALCGPLVASQVAGGATYEASLSARAVSAAATELLYCRPRRPPGSARRAAGTRSAPTA